MKSVLFDGKLEPKYATVYAGLNSPVFPLFKIPFHKLLTFGNGLSNNKYMPLKQTIKTLGTKVISYIHSSSIFCK